MPGTHSPISRPLFTLDGSVRTTGGAKNLAKGQFTIVNSGKAGANGAVVVGDFQGLPDNTVYEMRLGKSPLPENRTAINRKPYSSQLFTIKDVVDIKANAPKHFKQEFDDLLVGYDGINEDTAIQLEEDQTTVLDIELSGDHVGFLTGNKKHIVKIHFGKSEGETDEQVIERAVEVLKYQTLPGDVPVSELIDVKVINSENLPLDGTAYVFSELTLIDSGDSNAFAKVQAQYPNYKVTQKARSGSASVYTIMHPSTVSLTAFNQIVTDAFMKDCDDCPAGYEELEGGVVYSVKIEDDGTDLTTTVDNLPGFVTGSVVKHGNEGGIGIYTVVLDNELTDAEIATYVGTAGAQATAQIRLVGDLKEVCYDTTTTTVAWVAGDTCYASVETYTIQLKDNDCGESRLAELQAAYPNLTIEAGAATGEASQALTLTGTSGTANVNVGGTDYLATFATSLTVTATNFVTAHAADILEATGLVVTANGAVLTFSGDGEGFPAISIANATTNLAGTVAAIDYVTVATLGGCQRVYSTQVITDVVCDECDPMFIEQFVSEAPQAYDFTEWEKVEAESSETALMGIRITGKPFIFYPDEASRDQVPFYETSTRIRVAGGYIEEQNLSFQPIYGEIFNVKRLSRAQDRDNLGAHLMQWEDMSRTYFDGTSRHKDNQYAKKVFGEETVLKWDQQYVSYDILIHDSKYSQRAGGTSNMGMSYIVYAPLGKHYDLEAYVNSLAARAGLDAVNVLPAP